jgi:hypothetical protein
MGEASTGKRMSRSEELVPQEPGEDLNRALYRALERPGQSSHSYFIFHFFKNDDGRSRVEMFTKPANIPDIAVVGLLDLVVRYITEFKDEIELA